MTGAANFAFLHGGGQGSWVWRETIAAMHQQTDGAFGRALSLDVPGCGEKRGRDTSGIGLHEIVDELLADIARAGMQDVILVGHSQAGNVLPRMVQKSPTLFRRVVYVSCSSPAPGQTLMQLMGTARSGSDPKAVGWPFDPEVVTDMRQRYGIMFCNDMTAAERERFLDKLGPDAWPMAVYSATDWTYDRLDTVPGTFVVCLRDNILPIAWQETFALQYKATRQVHIDAGHQVMNTRPQALAEVLRLEAAL